jgi:putative transposase
MEACGNPLVTTTDRDHDGPIFPDLAKDMAPNGRDQLWVADLTYVAIPGGYAIGRSIDARQALAALWAAIRLTPAAGWLRAPFGSSVAVCCGILP